MPGGGRSGTLAAAALLALLLACQAAPAPRQVRGIITAVQPRNVAHADSIQLRLDNGQTMELAVADSVQFPPGHLREHMVFAEPVTVTYVEGPKGAVATDIVD